MTIVPEGTVTCGSHVTGSTAGATQTIPGDPGKTVTCASPINSNLSHCFFTGDHIYKFVAPYDSSFTFSTCGSSFDTYVLVYRDFLGSVVDECDTCGSCGSRASLTVDLTAVS